MCGDIAFPVHARKENRKEEGHDSQSVFCENEPYMFDVHECCLEE